jgi:hypothetical protein
LLRLYVILPQTEKKHRVGKKVDELNQRLNKVCGTTKYTMGM